MKTVLDAMRIHDALTPIMAGLEPPGLATVGIAQLAGIWQAPIAELRTEQRLLARRHGVALRTEQPVAATSESVHEAIPIVATVGNRRVEVIIREIALHMEARRERRIVDDEPRRIIGLEPQIETTQPGAMLGVVDEIDAPILVDQSPAENRGMIAVAIDDALERRLLAFARALGRIAAVGQLRPDRQARADPRRRNSADLAP